MKLFAKKHHKLALMNNSEWELYKQMHPNVKKVFHVKTMRCNPKQPLCFSFLSFFLFFFFFFFLNNGVFVQISHSVLLISCLWCCLLHFAAYVIFLIAVLLHLFTCFRSSMLCCGASMVLFSKFSFIMLYVHGAKNSP